MRATDLLQNIRNDFFYHTLPQAAIETATVGVFSFTSSNKKELFKDLGRSIGNTTTTMVAQNSIEFCLLNYYIKRRNQTGLDFQTILTCRMVSSFSAKTIANITFTRRKDVWAMLFSPLFYGLGNGLLFMFDNPQLSLNYFKSRFPLQYDELVQMIHQFGLDQIYEAFVTE